MRLQTVLDGNLCSGCGLCASILGEGRARMEMVEPGYLRPVLSGQPTPEEDQLIGSVCPGSQVTVDVGDRPMTPDWGPLLSVRTGHATDPSLRHRASSGGAISTLLRHLLAQPDGAAYVLHVGTHPTVPWLNAVGESRSDDDIADRAGSRYAPSAPLAGIRNNLARGERFVVVGKPCDIAALRAYAKHDPRVDQLVVAMISFMCGGIPSEKGIRQLLERLDAPPEKTVAFRYRGNGWPGQATATLQSGDEKSISYAKSWGDVLSKHMQLRCKICADGTGMSADVVCADAWYGDARGYPLFDEQDGRSLVIARTAKGSKLIDAAVTAGRLAVSDTTTDDMLKMQPFQARRTRLTLSRLIALRLVLRPAPSYVGMTLWKAARRAGLRANVRSFLGMLARGLTRRL